MHLFCLFDICYLQLLGPYDTMSDVVALCASLTRLGFSAKAYGVITNDQGLDTSDELKVLTNDEIESLCEVVRRPGGTNPNTNDGDPWKPDTLLS